MSMPKRGRETFKCVATQPPRQHLLMGTGAENILPYLTTPTTDDSRGKRDPDTKGKVIQRDALASHK